MPGSMGRTVENYLVHVLSPESYRGRPAPEGIRSEDADLIQRFVDHRRLYARSLTDYTAKITAQYLVMTARELHGLSGAETDQWIRVLSTFKKNLKRNTCRRIFPIIKQFTSWLVEEGINPGLQVQKIRSVQTPGPDYQTRKPSDMLTGEELKKMIETAGDIRNKALIAMLYEGALRPIEAVSAVWDDLTFDRYGARFITARKTGKPRNIRLILAADYLKQWRNEYPGTPEGDAPLFVAIKSPYNPITQSGIKTVIYDVVRKAGIKKHINPYSLRHSRITALIADEVPESMVKTIAWGSVRSNMLATYLHLKDSDIDRVLLTRAGVEVEEKTRSESLKKPQCPNCGQMNSLTARYCEVCGHPLTEEAKQEKVSMEQMITELYQKYQEEKQKKAGN